MAHKGMSADEIPDDLPADLADVERIHRLHREIGAPDLKADPAWALLGDGQGGETQMSRGKALALGQLHENSRILRRQIAIPRVCGRGHDLSDPANVYVGKKGSQCRQCRNASYRKAA